MNNDLLHQIALTGVPGIGPVQARLLIENFGTAEAIFKAKTKELVSIEGIGDVRAKAIKEFVNFEKAEKEIIHLHKNNIDPLFITHEKYPQRLLNCYDPPSMLYYKGAANLNAPRIIAVIGTRNYTDYGKKITEKLIDFLAGENILIVSGLALGIDSIAHKAALANQLETIGVLAHGLSHIYPSIHKSLANEMMEKGGLLSEFNFLEKANKHHFPIRNRVVAGMCDATVVIETAKDGGSMITAELANNYNKDVFAFPGRTNDIKSEGCNALIKQNKAILLTDGKQLLQTMGWHANNENKKTVKQKELFVELTKEEKIITDIIKEKDVAHIDEINIKSSLSSSRVANIILQLELKNIVVSLPGKRYKLS